MQSNLCGEKKKKKTYLRGNYLFPSDSRGVTVNLSAALKSGQSLRFVSIKLTLLVKHVCLRRCKHIAGL